MGRIGAACDRRKWPPIEEQDSQSESYLAYQKPMNEQPPFEEAYTQLEEAVRALEAGGVTLEEATRLFEEGMRLARVCHQYLSATELKITHLQRSFGEQMALLDEASKQKPDA